LKNLSLFSFFIWNFCMIYSHAFLFTFTFRLMKPSRMEKLSNFLHIRDAYYFSFSYSLYRGILVINISSRECYCRRERRASSGGKKMYIEESINAAQLAVILLLLFLTSIIILGSLYVKAGPNRARSNTV